jgi:hypothetical protein
VRIGAYPPFHLSFSKQQNIKPSVPGEKVNILAGHSIGHSNKKFYMNTCPIPNGFRYLAGSVLNLARHIFLPSRRNAPMSEACESV